jgi:hypothetical protein
MRLGLFKMNSDGKMWLEKHSPSEKRVCDAKDIFFLARLNPKMPLVTCPEGALMEAILALESLEGHVRASSRALALALALLIFLFAPLAQAFAARLGGAYYVDDAEIGKPGSCEIESWSSFAANGDRIAVFSPACVVNPGRPVEVGTNLVDLRSNGQEDVLATLTAKTVPIPIGRNGFGLAIAGAIVYDPLNQTGSGLIINIPLSFEFSKQLRVNINFGAQYYSGGEPNGLFATAGAGVSWNFVPHWSVISEVFALMGPGQTNPRFQTGLRYSPTKGIDCDLIYGRNLLGEGANWVTVGLTVRIGDN